MLRNLLICGLLVSCTLPAAAVSRRLLMSQDPKIVARQILAERGIYRFDAMPVPRAPTLWQRLAQWAAPRIRRLLDRIFSGVHVSARLGALVGDAVLVVAVIVLLVLCARLSLRGHTVTGATVGDSALPLPLRASQFYAQSCAAAERGNFAAAFSRLFQASTALLDEARILDRRATRTVGEYRRELQHSRPSALTAFETVARGFTVTVYAEQRLAERDWYDAQAAYAALREDVKH